MSKDAEIARCNQRILTTNSQISSTESTIATYKNKN